MRYMLLVYSTEMQKPTPEAREVPEKMRAVMNEMSKRGVFRGAEPLEPTPTAKTIRNKNGNPMIMDGPFAETKEQLAGYFILDCENLEQAVEWAKQLPTACKGDEGCIEVRPIVPVPQPGTPEFEAAGRSFPGSQTH